MAIILYIVLIFAGFLEGNAREENKPMDDLELKIAEVALPGTVAVEIGNPSQKPGFGRIQIAGEPRGGAYCALEKDCVKPLFKIPTAYSPGMYRGLMKSPEARISNGSSISMHKIGVR